MLTADDQAHAASLRRPWGAGSAPDLRDGPAPRSSDGPPEQAEEELHDGHLDVRAVWQLTSMSLGAGVFAIPSVFVQLGVVQAALWLCLLGLLANMALQRLLDLAAAQEATSYEALAELALGGAGRWVMLLVTFLAPLIASLSYVSTAKGLLGDVAVAFLVGVDVHAAPNGVEVLAGGKEAVAHCLLVAAVMPLCLSPSMDGKGWISALGVFSMVAASLFFLGRCTALLILGCGEGIQCAAQRPPLFAGSVADALQLVATLAFSFSMVFGLFPVLQERAAVFSGDVARAVPQMKRAVRCSVLLCCVIYFAIGLVGSMTFGAATKTIALGNLPLAEPLTQFITFVVGVSVELLVAIVSFPSLQALQQLLALCFGEGDKERSWPRLVVLLGAAIVAIDSFLPTKIAFALGGSLGLSLAAYLMPGLLYLRLAGGGAPQARRAAAVAVCGFGLALLVASTPVSLVSLLSGDDGTSPAPQPLLSFICSASNSSAPIHWGI